MISSSMPSVTMILFRAASQSMTTREVGFEMLTLEVDPEVVGVEDLELAD